MVQYAQKLRKLDPRAAEIRFQPGVQSAFGELAAPLRRSEHVDQGMLATLNDLASGKSISVDDLVGTLPLLAEESIKHVVATNDQSVGRAWRQVASQLVEERFSLAAPNRSRSGERE